MHQLQHNNCSAVRPITPAPQPVETGHPAFGRFLRFWRGVFNLSQEDLAERLDCSPRHVSRLENGSSRPSETMVRQICSALVLGRRDSNHLMVAAGFAPEEEFLDFHAPEYRWLRKAMAMNLRALEPYPTALLDSAGNLAMVNHSWVRFFLNAVPRARLDQVGNYYEFLFHRDGVGGHVSNWENALSVILMTITQHALFTNKEEDLEVMRRLEKHPYLPGDWKRRAAAMEPMTSFRLQITIDGKLERFFSVMSTVGALGPSEYNSEPNYSIHTLYPENDDFDLEGLAEREVDHPLLAY
ncbi:helix-turn-helix domain-containing protein [Microbulbifer sp. YPW1]|uniref:helix-turn-helix domain-containing protein n=1 Tax=Microbulbifer sp. YPW1 TaxID=2745199 RepID=UPI0015994E9C|nr:helix-turn-helix transcriptional regulator [Microbulbifer sp. YPW1]QKX17201.1 helix-turn-helix transcriptional regulator [Microbulbifer sp. YPW1]